MFLTKHRYPPAKLHDITSQSSESEASPTYKPKNQPEDGNSMFL
jgi:hypothetical protein